MPTDPTEPTAAPAGPTWQDRLKNAVDAMNKGISADVHDRLQHQQVTLNAIADALLTIPPAPGG